MIESFWYGNLYICILFDFQCVWNFQYGFEFGVHDFYTDRMDCYGFIDGARHHTLNLTSAA